MADVVPACLFDLSQSRWDRGPEPAKVSVSRQADGERVRRLDLVPIRSDRLRCGVVILWTGASNRSRNHFAGLLPGAPRYR